MLTTIFTILSLVYTLLWSRTLYRMYKTIRRYKGLTVRERTILVRQVIALSPAILVFILMTGKLFYPYLTFFDSGAFFIVFLLILMPILTYIGVTALKYRVAISKEPIQGSGAILIGLIAISSVVLQTGIILFFIFF